MGESVKVKLGGKEREIQPLRGMVNVRAWLDQYQAYVAGKAEQLGQQGLDAAAFSKGFADHLTMDPAKNAELLLVHSPELREAVDNDATSTEIYQALQECLLLENPTLASARMQSLQSALAGMEKVIEGMPRNGTASA